MVPKQLILLFFYDKKIFSEYFRFCDRNCFCSKVPYGYKLDIHEKIVTINATYSTINGLKTDFFAIFFLSKIILGYFWFSDQN